MYWKTILYLSWFGYFHSKRLLIWKIHCLKQYVQQQNLAATWCYFTSLLAQGVNSAFSIREFGRWFCLIVSAITIYELCRVLVSFRKQQLLNKAGHNSSDKILHYRCNMKNWVASILQNVIATFWTCVYCVYFLKFPSCSPHKCESSLMISNWTWFVILVYLCTDSRACYGSCVRIKIIWN